MTKKSKNKVTIDVDTSLFINLVYPDLLYTVQNLLKQQGVQFIDLNTGLIVTGNLNINTLGMITKKSFKKSKKKKGNADHFLIPPKSQKIYDIEATINIYEPESPNDPTIFTIQVIDENDIEFWHETLVGVGQNFIYQKPSGRLGTEAVFQLIPLSLPNPKDPKSAIQAMLGNLQRYRSGEKTDLDMLPGYAYPSFDSDYGEEELDP